MEDSIDIPKRLDSLTAEEVSKNLAVARIRAINETLEAPIVHHPNTKMAMSLPDFFVSLGVGKEAARSVVNLLAETYDDEMKASFFALYNHPIALRSSKKVKTLKKFERACIGALIGVLVWLIVSLLFRG